MILYVYAYINLIYIEKMIWLICKRVPRKGYKSFYGASIIKKNHFKRKGSRISLFLLEWQKRRWESILLHVTQYSFFMASWYVYNLLALKYYTLSTTTFNLGEATFFPDMFYQTWSLLWSAQDEET